MNEMRSSLQEPTFPFYYLWTRNSTQLIRHEEVTRFSAEISHDPFITVLPRGLNGVGVLTLSLVSKNLRFWSAVGKSQLMIS